MIVEVPKSINEEKKDTHSQVLLVRKEEEIRERERKKAKQDRATVEWEGVGVRKQFTLYAMDSFMLSVHKGSLWSRKCAWVCVGVRCAPRLLRT